jgi:hypothetical protein
MQLINILLKKEGPMYFHVFFILLLVFFCNCERQFIVTEHVINPENQFITGFCGTRKYRVTIDRLYSQYFSIYGYDDSQISVTVDTMELTEEENLTCREFVGQYELKHNQKVTVHFNIDNLSGKYSDIVPDSIRIRNYQERDSIPDDKSLLIEWYPVNNADYYFIKVYLNIYNYIPDTILTTYDTQFILQKEYLKNVKDYDFIIYAVSGLPPQITDQSNIQGNLKGRIYVCSTLFMLIRKNRVSLIYN